MNANARAPAPPLPRRRGRRGYTAVEVMISLTLLAVGAAGIISMQRGTVEGNLHARNLDTANAILRSWVERLRTDATAWTLPSPSNTSANNITNTRFFTDNGTILIDTGRTGTDNGWYLPNQGMDAGMSPAADLLGRDLDYLSQPTPPTSTQPLVQFCTHVKLDCLAPTVVPGGSSTTCDLLRASVRVLWPRTLVGAVPSDFCTIANVGAVEQNPQLYHFVYATTAIRKGYAP